jgi:hypothetical protein
MNLIRKTFKHNPELFNLAGAVIALFFMAILGVGGNVPPTKLVWFGGWIVVVYMGIYMWISLARGQKMLRRAQAYHKIIKVGDKVNISVAPHETNRAMEVVAINGEVVSVKMDFKMERIFPSDEI